MVDEDSHSTDLNVSGEGHSKILLAHYILGFNWGQSYLATLVTPENCTKMLRNLTFVVQFAYFSIRQREVLLFRATFGQLPLQKVTFDQRFDEPPTGNFLGTLEQLVESLKKTRFELSKFILGSEPGGGYSREFRIGVCREGSWTLTLFKD